MVTISSYEARQGTDGVFFVLVLQGDVEFVQSQTTGMPYATVKKTTMPSTFDEATCKSLIGKKMPGSIVKMTVDEYEFTIPETKDVVILDYTYVYSPEEHASMEVAVFEHQVVA